MQPQQNSMHLQQLQLQQMQQQMQAHIRQQGAMNVGSNSSKSAGINGNSGQTIMSSSRNNGGITQNIPQLPPHQIYQTQMATPQIPGNQTNTNKSGGMGFNGLPISMMLQPQQPQNFQSSNQQQLENHQKMQQQGLYWNSAPTNNVNSNFNNGINVGNMGSIDIANSSNLMNMLQQTSMKGSRNVSRSNSLTTGPRVQPHVQHQIGSQSMNNNVGTVTAGEVQNDFSMIGGSANYRMNQVQGSSTNDKVLSDKDKLLLQQQKLINQLHSQLKHLTSGGSGSGSASANANALMQQLKENQSSLSRNNSALLQRSLSTASINATLSSSSLKQNASTNSLLQGNVQVQRGVSNQQNQTFPVVGIRDIYINQNQQQNMRKNAMNSNYFSNMMQMPNISSCAGQSNMVHDPKQYLNANAMMSGIANSQMPNAILQAQLFQNAHGTLNSDGQKAQLMQSLYQMRTGTNSNKNLGNQNISLPNMNQKVKVLSTSTDEQGSGTNQNAVKQMQIVRDQLLKFEKEKSNKSEDCDDKKNDFKKAPKNNESKDDRTDGRRNSKSNGKGPVKRRESGLKKKESGSKKKETCPSKSSSKENGRRHSQEKIGDGKNDILPDVEMESIQSANLNKESSSSEIPTVGGWQSSNNDLPDRHRVIVKVVKVIEEMRPDAKRMLNKIPLMAIKLEEHLYRSARTKKEYMNPETLKKRLQMIAHALGVKKPLSEDFLNSNPSAKYVDFLLDDASISENSVIENVQSDKSISILSNNKADECLLSEKPHNKENSNVTQGKKKSEDKACTESSEEITTKKIEETLKMLGQSQDHLKYDQTIFPAKASKQKYDDLGEFKMKEKSNEYSAKSKEIKGSNGNTTSVLEHGCQNDRHQQQINNSQQNSQQIQKKAQQKQIHQPLIADIPTSFNFMNGSNSLQHPTLHHTNVEHNQAHLIVNQFNQRSRPNSSSGQSQSDHTISAKDKHEKNIRQQQQRLLLLRHASKCTAGPSCKTPSCAEYIQLWKHMKKCKKGKACDTPHCLSSRCLLTHYRVCKSLNKSDKCGICAPVWKQIKRQALQSGRSQNFDHMEQFDNEQLDFPFCGIESMIPGHNGSPNHSVVADVFDSNKDNANRSSINPFVSRPSSSESNAIVNMASKLADIPKNSQHIKIGDGGGSSILNYHNHDIQKISCNLMQQQHEQQLSSQQRKQLHQLQQRQASFETNSAREIHDQKSLLVQQLQMLQKDYQQKIGPSNADMDVMKDKQLRTPLVPNMPHDLEASDSSTVKKRRTSTKLANNNESQAGKGKKGKSTKCKRVKKPDNTFSQDSGKEKKDKISCDPNVNFQTPFLKSKRPFEKISSCNEEVILTDSNDEIQKKSRIDEISKKGAIQTINDKKTSSCQHYPSKEAHTSLMYYLDNKSIDMHLESLNEKSLCSTRQIAQKCLPIIEKLLNDRYGWVFRDPVNPEELGIPDYFDVVKYPMDLSLVKKKLEEGAYKEIEVFARETKLIFENAILYNGEKSDVGDMAKSLIKLFNKEFVVVQKCFKSDQKNVNKKGKEDTCILCNSQRRQFEPTILYCNGTCGQRIRRNATCYTDKFKLNHWCSSCYVSLGDEELILLDDDSKIKKRELQQLKNDALAEEAWVQCDECLGWVHQICSLFNGRKNKTSSSYLCPQCFRKKKNDPNFKENEHLKNRMKIAKDIPSCSLSNALEKELTEMLDKEYYIISKDRGCSVGAVEKAHNLTVRVVSNMEKKTVVCDGLRSMYSNDEFPSEFVGRSKCILLFQTIHGVDVLLFAMYVYEYNKKCPLPNRRRVYISYLDSVNFFQPKRYRTTAYHAILKGYLRHVKHRGFHTVHIWSCSPSKGDDYIFYCRPQNQRLPRDDVLCAWYHTLLNKAKNEGLVVNITTMFDEYFNNDGKSKENTLGSFNIPYFDGDYIPGEVENIVKDIKNSDVEKRNNDALRSKPGGVDVKLKDELMARLGLKLGRMKDNFIVVHLFDKATVQKMDEEDKANAKTTQKEGPGMNNKDHHSAFSYADGGKIKKIDEIGDTFEKDPANENDLFDSRQQFLNYCQCNNFQFDELRRAKHTTMMILYNFHNPTAPKYLQQCGACYREITHGVRYHCNNCSNFDLCQDCYDPVVSGLWAQRDPRFAHDKSHRFTAINMETSEEAQMSNEERAHSIKVHLERLKHAATCAGLPSCTISSCQRMKNLFDHMNICPETFKNECKTCTRFLKLVSLHAKYCSVQGNCPVPYCDRIKERNRRIFQKQQQMDEKRREAQNQRKYMGNEIGN